MSTSPFGDSSVAVHPSEVRKGDRLALAQPQRITGVRTEGKGDDTRWYFDLEGGKPAGPITGDSTVFVHRNGAATSPGA